MIDMENMFDLLATNPQLRDAPGAKPLALSSGTVEFDDVGFEYNQGTPVLKAVSFR
jgi:ATP-binding cassette, subfamily B, heavy metal transporter